MVTLSYCRSADPKAEGNAPCPIQAQTLSCWSFIN